jgi:hypothetical protein
MATYKVWLTVRDSYGNIKELDGGNINFDFSELTSEDVSKIVKKLDPYFTTDKEVEHAVENSDLIKYSDLDLKPEN